jgi:hypothetical protein
LKGFRRRDPSGLSWTILVLVVGFIGADIVRWPWHSAAVCGSFRMAVVNDEQRDRGDVGHVGLEFDGRSAQVHVADG